MHFTLKATKNGEYFSNDGMKGILFNYLYTNASQYKLTIKQLGILLPTFLCFLFC